MHTHRSMHMQMTLRTVLPRLRRRVLPLALAALIVFPACRGSVSDQPPIHPNPNMDTQAKLKPQRESHFFADGASMRTPVEHTVARGELRADDAMYRGKLADGSYVDSPVGFGADVLARGRERYEIYCTPCHGSLGNGRGKIMDYKYPIPPTSYFDPRILAAKDGYIFEVISNGVRNMAAYKAQISVRDRWCIVAHVRELQKAPLHDSLKNVMTPQAVAAQPAPTASK